VQIFATDVSEKLIEKARVGLYHKSELEDVTDSRLQQFFIKTEDHYQVKKSIRDMCVFARHNFLKDPPFAKIDLISCRNVLIYMEPFLQKKALNTFHYALNDKGYLFLGKSETIGSSSELFLPLGKNEKLYTKKVLPGRYMQVASERQEETLKDKDYGLRSNEKRKDDLQKNADDILLAKYTPPGVIVNDQLDIVQFRGLTGEFLEPSPGKASLNVLKMAREGLSFELRNALHKAKSSNKPFRKEGIPLNNGERLITIDVIPLLNAIELHFLILFKDTSPAIINKSAGGKNAQKSAVLKNSPENIRIHELEDNLSQAREDMRSITEQQDAVNAELQSTNEELLSGSEELQSLNEELETSKEELESTNEELITVNQELFDRNEQFNQARLYAEAIVTTIHEPLLILNEDYRVKSANESFYKTFQLTPKETVGNILFELQNRGWDIPGLRKQLLEIKLGNQKFLELEITYTFPLAGKRTICFKAQPIQKENGENRILLALDDITLRKEKESAEKKYSEELIKLLENIPQITLTASADGAITYFNKFFLDYSGMTFDEALKKGWEPLIKPEMLDEFKKSWGQVLQTGEDFKMELQLKKKNENTYRWHLYRASPIRNDKGDITSWVGAATDLHDQKTREQVKDEFMSIASHELKTPLTTAKAYIQLLQMGMEETNNKDLVYAQKAGASINRLNDLIGELLDVSKIQNGKLNLNFASFNFNEMMTDAIESVQCSSPSHNIVRSGVINEPVTGDKERLQQVVVNLLSNAVKYSPEANKVIVTIGKEKGKVKVSVKDRGIGIRRENLWKIFERYYREEERAIHFQGLGIGLYISYEIIQRHKGKLWAEINGGRGSTFYFTVPI
jgi:two-component system CheB/CheR fusion protein